MIRGKRKTSRTDGIQKFSKMPAKLQLLTQKEKRNTNFDCTRAGMILGIRKYLSKTMGWLIEEERGSKTPDKFC